MAKDKKQDTPNKEGKDAVNKKEETAQNTHKYDKLYAETDVRTGNNPLVNPNWKDDGEVQPLDPKRPPVDNDPYRRYDQSGKADRERGLYASRYGAMADMEDYDNRYAQTDVRPGNNPMFYDGYDKRGVRSRYPHYKYDARYAQTDVRTGNNPLVNPHWQEDGNVQPVDPKRPPIDADPYGRYNRSGNRQRKRGYYAGRYGAMAEMEDLDRLYAKTDVRPGNNPMYYDDYHKRALEAEPYRKYDELYAKTDVRPGNNPLVNPYWPQEGEIQPLDPKRPPVDNDPYRRYEGTGNTWRNRGYYASRYGALADLEDYDNAMGRSDRHAQEQAARYHDLYNRLPYATYNDDYEGGDAYLRAVRRMERERYMPAAEFQGEYEPNAYDRYYGHDPFEAYRQKGREQYRQARANWQDFADGAQDKWQGFADQAQATWDDMGAKAGDAWDGLKEKADEVAHPYKMQVEDQTGDEVTVDKRAIEQLTKNAVAEVDGIIALDGGFMGQFAQAFDYDGAAGVSVSGTEKPILNMRVILEYGAPGPQVLRALRERIKDDLKKTLDLTLDAVHVEVTNVMTMADYEAQEKAKAGYRA